MPPLTLLCACNSDLVFAAAVLLRSARAHTTVPIRAYCFLDDDVAVGQRRALARFADAIELDLRLWSRSDLPPPQAAALERMTQGRGPGWRAALARLVMPDGMGSDVARALYVDVDTLVVGDLASASTLDLGGAVLGAVQAPLEALQSRSSSGRYFNSGVLLIDVDRWRAQGWGPRIVEAVAALPADHPMADQDALNDVLNEAEGARWYALDPSWNVLTPMFLPRGPVVYDAPSTAKVLHFAGTAKPWADADHPFAPLYARTLAEVPFDPPAGASGLFAHV